MAWIPVFIATFVALGLSAKHLGTPAPTSPAPVAEVFSFISIIAGFVLTWSGLSSDFSTYMRPDSSK